MESCLKFFWSFSRRVQWRNFFEKKLKGRFFLAIDQHQIKLFASPLLLEGGSLSSFHEVITLKVIQVYIHPDSLGQFCPDFKLSRGMNKLLIIWFSSIFPAQAFGFGPFRQRIRTPWHFEVFRLKNFTLILSPKRKKVNDQSHNPPKSATKGIFHLGFRWPQASAPNRQLDIAFGFVKLIEVSQILGRRHVKEIGIFQFCIGQVMPGNIKTKKPTTSFFSMLSFAEGWWRKAPIVPQWWHWKTKRPTPWAGRPPKKRTF